MSSRPRIGLALGGGGARGLSHIGVLKALEREGIPVDLIVGTSIGALVGAAYALQPHAETLERLVADFIEDEKKQGAGFKLLERVHRPGEQKSDFLHRLARLVEKEVFLNLALFRDSLLSEKGLRGCVEPFVRDVDMSETLIPFSSVAVDLISGKEVLLTEGPIIPAVMASCAVPGFMKPIHRDGMVLVDGGVVDAVPVNPAKTQGADIVIGVDVGGCVCQVPPIEDGIDAINRATEIMSFHLNRHAREMADIVIEPAVREREWTDFLSFKDFIREGEKATEASVKQIKKLMKPELKWRLSEWHTSYKRAREMRNKIGISRRLPGDQNGPGITEGACEI